MSITFKDKTEAMEYARKKQEEGYAIDICGGSEGNYGYIITLKGKRNLPKNKRTFSPYINQDEIYTKETNNHMLKRTENMNVRKLRNKKRIIEEVKKEFKKNGYNKVNVKIEDIEGKDGMSDANIERENGIITLKIHPIHQYTTNENFKATLEHEINHLKNGET